MRLHAPLPFLPIFSLRPGTKVLLPGSTIAAEAFPTALRLSGKELHFPGLGAPREWRVLVDAMRRTVCLEGKGVEGFFRLCIEQEEGALCLRSMKGPLQVDEGGRTTVLQRGDTLVLAKNAPRGPCPPLSRLLLGCNKELCCDRISASLDMNEVLPLWYQFGPGGVLTDKPSKTLFGAVVEAIQTKDRGAVFPAFCALFRAGIEGVFVPKRHDDRFLGYSIAPWPEGMEDVQSHVSAAIRSLFLTEDGSTVDLLPCLPRECAAGRLLREPLLSGHLISLEWRKGCLRRVLLEAAHDGVVAFRTAMGSGSIRTSSGRKKSIVLAEPFEVRGGEAYLIDNLVPPSGGGSF